MDKYKKVNEMKIEIRKWTLDDAAGMADVCNNVDRTFLTNGLPYPYTEDNAKWWIENNIFQKEGTEGTFRAILVDGKVVGNISVERKSDVFSHDAEIGYLLLDEAKGKGVMTKAVEEVTKIAFDELDIIRITGKVYAPNIASIRVLEKNGYELEGTAKKAVVKNGNIYDMHIFGKLK